MSPIEIHVRFRNHEQKHDRLWISTRFGRAITSGSRSKRSQRPGKAVALLDPTIPAVRRPFAAARPIVLDTARTDRHREREPAVAGVGGTPMEDRRANVSVLSLLLGTGPRFARDAVGPVLVFYVGWRLAGLTPAIIAATALALATFVWERRRARTGLGAAIGLTIALTQAAAALATGSAVAYFLPPVVFNALYGVAFIVSVIIGRPLAGVFAQETYPFPPEVKASATFRRVFSRVSLAWGVYLLLRSAVRLVTLSWRDVELIVLVNILTGVPFTAALMTWSIWYGVHGFRRSDEWGQALRPAS